MVDGKYDYVIPLELLEYTYVCPQKYSKTSQNWIGTGSETGFYNVVAASS